jgi:hypothetical protein
LALAVTRQRSDAKKMQCTYMKRHVRTEPFGVGPKLTAELSQVVVQLAHIDAVVAAALSLHSQGISRQCCK